MTTRSLLLPLLLATACATSSGGPGGTASRPSSGDPAYAARFPDPGGPLDIRTLSTEQRGPATLVELTYAGAPDAPPVRATLVRPTAGGGGAAPGVLWVHWLGDPATSNRTEFLDEAVELAGAGVRSLLVDALWSGERWYRTRDIDQDPAAFTSQVVSLRRGLDLLVAEPGIDGGRLALVGHDFGGMTGLLALAADGRPHTAVLLAMTPRFENWMFYLPEKKPTDGDAYRRALRPLDPLDALSAVHVPVLLQLAEEDEFVPAAQVQAWQAAVRGHGEVRTYPTGHGMAAPAVRDDRTAWLRRTLGLPEAAAR